MTKRLLPLLLATVTLSLFSEPLDFGFVKEFSSVTAKALGMGGASSAATWDYDAANNNPACLTQIRSKDVHISYSLTSLRDSAWYDTLNMRGADGVAELKLKSIGYIYSFPVVRGSFVTSFGYSRPQDMLDIRSMRGGGRYNTVQSDGHTGQWTAAFGLDVAEDIGLGLGLSYVYGEENYTKQEQNSTYAQKDIFSGFAINGGWLYRLPNNIYFGGNIRFYNRLSNLRQANEDSANIRFIYPDDKTLITFPVMAKMGMAYVTTPLTISIDAGYSAWSDISVEYEGGAAVIRQNNLNDITTFNFGVEWLLPIVPVKIRVGTNYTPSLFSDIDQKNAWGYNGGIGLLLGGSLAIDAGAEFLSSDYLYKSATGAPIQENRFLRRGIITVSYRY